MDYYQAPNVEYVYHLDFNKGGCEGGDCGGKCSPSGKTKKRPISLKEEEIKERVRDAYGKVAEKQAPKQVCDPKSGCCMVYDSVDPAYSMDLGYDVDDIVDAPENSNLGLGCGNPHLISRLKEGEKVLDLGSGGGFDVFLAAKRVGNNGKVYGVDMTPSMVAKSRKNAAEAGYGNVEFLLGEIEHLPLPDNSVDVVISNCVVNLSTNKGQVFQEAYRVLKEGGRLAISDIMAIQEMSEEMREDAELYCGCIAGAISPEEIERFLSNCGFKEIEVVVKKESREFIKDWYPDKGVENYVAAGYIKARK
jgi:arsenite methyltransferase